ncbi:uncharacterized protein LOC129573058 [Sitodiplosis mosellana]|uniref:uncharacterized protein LOC129573058 n=1 Tax=Sitodiplosis mosellana TaxID=263140 RepID=UPI00244452BB|nr:uncharacterized protein LOC129573058 [Sitodiplosis mosellana]XP_055309211.1 uncharacterized protein LOC129573058 [Sitodiplosis mosellana]
MQRIAMLVVFLQAAIAMLIPEETEMLDGFGYLSFPEVPESSFENDYFEARSLSAGPPGPLFNSVRNKRDIKFDVKESKDDQEFSYFLPNNGEKEMFGGKKTRRKERSFRKFKKWLKKKFPQDESEEFTDEENFPSITNRKKRNTESEKRGKLASPREVANKSNLYLERMPTAMKLTKTLDGFTTANRDSPPAAAALVGKFARSPFDYSKIQHEEDSMAMDTSSLSMNEGIKSRTPKANFVTQQKKSLYHDDTKTSATKSASRISLQNQPPDFYKTPPLLHNSKDSTVSSDNERYPERSSTARPPLFPDHKNRDSYSNHYEDRYIGMYPPPSKAPTDMYDRIPVDYNAPYADFYLRRFPYSDYNVHYSGNRYDRDDFSYGNDVDSPYYMRTDIMPPSSSMLPRKRMIYYAYLPEVVRYDPYPYYRANDASMMSYRRPTERTLKYDYHTKSDDNDDMIRKPLRSYNDLHMRTSEYDSFYQ